MSILKSSIVVSLGTLSSRVLGFVRDLLIARYLGAGVASDIFFIGLRIPNAFRNIFGEGAFNMAFVPLFKQYCDDKNVNEKSLKFLEQSFSMFMLSIFVICVLAEIFMPQILNILAPALQTRGIGVYDLAVNIARIVMPYLLFVSYMTFMGAVLNSLGKFAAMAFAPAMVNVGYISGFIFYELTKTPTEITYVPAVGFLFGGFLQFLVMYISIKRMPFKIRFTKILISSEVKLLFKKFLPTILGSGIVVLNGLVSTFLASGLEKGAVSYLFYSDRLVQLPTALVGTAIATVLLPALTQKLKNGKNISIDFVREFSITLIISVFCAWFLFNNAGLIVEVLFQRGNFDVEATTSTAWALLFMSFAVPAIMSLKISNTVFYAQGNTKLPTIIAAFSFALNLGLCLYLMDDFSYLGLVFAGVIAAYFTVIVQLVILLCKKILKISDILRCFVYAIITGVILQLVYLFVNSDILYMWSVQTETRILYKLLYLFGMGIMGMILSMGMIWLFKLYKKA